MAALRAASSATAMAMRSASATSPLGLRQLFSTSAFVPPPFPPQSTSPPPKADPSPNLFVSGLSKRTTTEGLHEAFAKFGEVVHAKVVTDRVSGYSKGFGFVTYSTVEGATAGIEGMDGKFLDGWVIFAEYARPRQPQQNYGNPSFTRNSSFGGNPYGQHGGGDMQGRIRNTNAHEIDTRPLAIATSCSSSCEAIPSSTLTKSIKREWRKRVRFSSSRSYHIKKLR